MDATPARRLCGFLLDLLLVIVTLGAGWLVWSWVEWSRGRTPAMRLLGMSVVRTDGTPARRRTMVRREVLGKGAALLGGLLSLGVLWWLAATPVLLPGRRALWDVVAGTRVVGPQRSASPARVVIGRLGAAMAVALVATSTILFAWIHIPTAGQLAVNAMTGQRSDTVQGRPDAARCLDLRPATRVPTQGHQEDQGRLRVFAIGYHLRVEDARDYATYRDRMRCLVRDEVVPHLQPGRPTLVVFPEDVGLPAIALGRRGATARLQADTRARAVSAAVPIGMGLALGQLNLAYAPQIAAYQAAFGPVDPRKQVMLAATDTFVRSFMRTFSEIARDYGVYVVASNNMADYAVTTNPAKVAIFADPEAQPTDRAFVASSSRVTNTTFLWGPDMVDSAAPDYSGNLLARNEKVPLTPLETDVLGLDEGPATGPSALRNAGPTTVAGLRLAFATSLPAFTYGYDFGARPSGFEPCQDLRVSYAACQDALGVEVVLQADANPGTWPGQGGAGQYQPLEWMGATWRSVADPSVRFRYNVTPMMTGNLFDLTFDGQSTITERGAKQTPRHLVGNDQPHPEDGAPYRVYAGGKTQFLAMSPWVSDSDDRAAALRLAGELAGGSGSSRENAYVESVIWADLR